MKCAACADRAVTLRDCNGKPRPACKSCRRVPAWAWLGGVSELARIERGSV